MNLRIALVTAREALPLDEDMPPLRAALAQAGLSADTPCWDDPGVDWSNYDAALLRSTWDYVDRIDEFLDWCEQCARQTRLLNPPEIEHIQPVDIRYTDAADHFNEMQPVIAAELWSQFQHNGMRESHLEVANRILGQDIQASLVLGDLDLLKNEMEWLTGLLKTHNISVEYLPQYMAFYKQAVDENLDERGQPVKVWLDTVLNDMRIKSE